MLILHKIVPKLRIFKLLIQDYTATKSLTSNVIDAGKYQNWDQNSETGV